jgi:hypothetical protein
MHNSLGKHARVFVGYYDIHGNKIKGSASQEVIATSEDQEATINIHSFIDPRVYRVDVSTQVNNLATWDTEATKSVYIGSATHPSIPCKIDAPNLEFGGSGGVDHGHPVDAASCGWTVGSTFTDAQFDGTLYYENGKGVAVRLLFTTYDVHGNVLYNVPFGPAPAQKNGVVGVPAQTFTSPNDEVYKAQLTMQVEVGTDWVAVGNTLTWFI